MSGEELERTEVDFGRRLVFVGLGGGDVFADAGRDGGHLIHAEPCALEIQTLGEAEGSGVINVLEGDVFEGEEGTAVIGGEPGGFEEVGKAHLVGAGADDDAGAFLGAVEGMVDEAPDRPFEAIAGIGGFGDGGRIEDDPVVGAESGSGEVFENVGFDDGEIESLCLCIGAGSVEGDGVEVNADGLCAGASGGDAETAGVAEAVEEFFAGFDAGDEAAAGFALIEIEAGFEAVEDGNGECQPVFGDRGDLGTFSVKGAGGGFEAFFRAASHFGFFVDAGRGAGVDEGGKPDRFEFVHAEAADLDDEVFAEAVHDEAGDAIGFGAEDAVAVGTGDGGFALGFSGAEFGFEPGLINGFVLEGEDADGEAGFTVPGAHG